MADDVAAMWNEHRGPFTEWLGLVFDLVTPERITAHLDVTPALHQPFGLVHGGVYASIVETLGSIAATVVAQQSGKVVVGVSNATDFLRPVRDGRIEAVATPLHTGRLQHLWLVEMFRQDGKLAARGQLRGQLIDPDRDLAGQSARDVIGGDGT